MHIVAPLDRFVAHVRGEEALAFLHNVTTQDVLGLEPGQTALACTLDDKGRVLSELRVIATREGVLVDAGEAARDEVLVRLARIAPLQGVSIEPADLVVTAVRGAPAPGEGIAVPVDWGAPGHDVISRAPLEPVDAAAYEFARIEAGTPTFGIDVTPAMLVNETPYLARAVSFTKGCYPGQESVARVHNLGAIRRRLAGLELRAPVPRGSPVNVGGSSAGEVTSTAARDGRAVAIAVVRADVAAGDPVDVEGIAGSVRALL